MNNKMSYAVVLSSEYRLDKLAWDASKEDSNTGFSTSTNVLVSIIEDVTEAEMRLIALKWWTDNISPHYSSYYESGQLESIATNSPVHHKLLIRPISAGVVSFADLLTWQNKMTIKMNKSVAISTSKADKSNV